MDVSDYLGMNISVSLIEFSYEYIESEIVLTVVDDVDLDGTELECSIAPDLDTDTITVYVNTSGRSKSLYIYSVSVYDASHAFIFSLAPLTPTGFSLMAVYPEALNLTVSFGWDEPQSLGAETVVEFYEIYISYLPIYVVSSSSWNVTLNYNVIYNATTTAVNCAGRSSPAYIFNIEFGNSFMFIQLVVNSFK